MASPLWVAVHWFELLQSIGIVGGLIFTGISLRTDANVRQVQNLLKITEQHRNVWSPMYDNPNPHRIVSETADISLSQITFEEELFFLSVILHLNSVHSAIR